MYSNVLTGKIPSTFRNLERLTAFIVSQNILTGFGDLDFTENFLQLNAFDVRYP